MWSHSCTLCSSLSTVCVSDRLFRVESLPWSYLSDDAAVAKKMDEASIAQECDEDYSGSVHIISWVEIFMDMLHKHTLHSNRRPIVSDYIAVLRSMTEHHSITFGVDDGNGGDV